MDGLSEQGDGWTVIACGHGSLKPDAESSQVVVRFMSDEGKGIGDLVTLKDEILLIDECGEVLMPPYEGPALLLVKDVARI